MKLFFVYPAKAFLTPFPKRAHRELAHNGARFVVFDNVHVYGASDGTGAKWSKEEGNTYFIEIEPGIFARAGSANNDAHFIQKLGTIDAPGLNKYREEQRLILGDMPYYEQKKLEAIREREEKRKMELAKREAERLNEESRLNKLAKDTFIGGGRVSFGRFEALCKEYGIEMPIQTIGAARKSVKEIGHGSMAVIGKSRPDDALRAARELFNKMQSTEEK